MVKGFRIEYLEDYPEYVEACAAWAYGRWGVQNKNGSLERSLGLFNDGAQKNAIPMTVIVVNEKNGLPVAMGSLREKDGEIWGGFTPWIASVYTLYRYRGLGIAGVIVQRLEDEARRLGFDNVYLMSGSAAGFYLKNGYKAVDMVKTGETKSGTQTLLVKNLQEE